MPASLPAATGRFATLSGVEDVPTPTDLPFVDVHETRVAAPPSVVWHALARDVAGGGALTEAFAGTLGCEPRRRGGPPVPEAGAEVPGFRVVESRPGAALVLAGRHRFSRYALVFGLEPLPDGATRLTAETRAAFPGVRGTLYRALVIGTRTHVVAVRAMLARIRRRAERSG
jgi:hypothetical protein